MPRDLIYALCIRCQLVGPLEVGLGIACDHSTTVKTQHRSTIVFKRLVHTTIGCGKRGFPSAQPYLSQYYERAQEVLTKLGFRLRLDPLIKYTIKKRKITGI